MNNFELEKRDCIRRGLMQIPKETHEKLYSMLPYLSSMTEDDLYAAIDEINRYWYVDQKLLDQFWDEICKRKRQEVKTKKRFCGVLGCGKEITEDADSDLMYIDTGYGRAAVCIDCFNSFWSRFSSKSEVKG